MHHVSFLCNTTDLQILGNVAVWHAYLVRRSVMPVLCLSELCKALVQGLPQTGKQQCQNTQHCLPCLQLFCQQLQCRLARCRWGQTPWLEGRPHRPRDPCWQPNGGLSDPMHPANITSTYNQKSQGCNQTRAIKPTASCTHEVHRESHMPQRL